MIRKVHNAYEHSYILSIVIILTNKTFHIIYTKSDGYLVLLSLTSRYYSAIT